MRGYLKKNKGIEVIISLYHHISNSSVGTRTDSTLIELIIIHSTRPDHFLILLDPTRSLFSSTRPTRQVRLRLGIDLSRPFFIREIKKSFVFYIQKKHFRETEKKNLFN